MVAGRFSDHQAPAIRIASHAKETVLMRRGMSAWPRTGGTPDQQGQVAARKSVGSPKHRRRNAALAAQLA